MSRKFKVHTVLSIAELAALEAFAAHPGRTVDDCRDWLCRHGRPVKRSAVGRWKKQFDREQRKRRLLTAAGGQAGEVRIELDAPPVTCARVVSMPPGVSVRLNIRPPAA